jgi:hypothetical protein
MWVFDDENASRRAHLNLPITGIETKIVSVSNVLDLYRGVSSKVYFSFIGQAGFVLARRTKAHLPKSGMNHISNPASQLAFSPLPGRWHLDCKGKIKFTRALKMSPIVF